MQSFLTLSLENVAHHVKLSGGASEAEKYIRDMVGATEHGDTHMHTQSKHVHVYNSSSCHCIVEDFGEI